MLQEIRHRKDSIKKEISKLTNVKLQRWLEECILLFPEYFWVAPASGTGMYHDEDENFEGGLVLHTLRVVRLCKDLAVFYDLTTEERDILISSAILHDSFSKGLNDRHNKDNTDVFHPLYPAFKLKFEGFAEHFLTKDMYDQIMECVAAHSGKWSVSPLLNVDRKLPNILKMADFVGSRRYIKINL